MIKVVSLTVHIEVFLIFTISRTCWNVYLYISFHLGIFFLKNKFLKVGLLSQRLLHYLWHYYTLYPLHVYLPTRAELLLPVYTNLTTTGTTGYSGSFFSFSSGYKTAYCKVGLCLSTYLSLISKDKYYNSYMSYLPPTVLIQFTLR